MAKAVVFFAEGTEECEALLVVDLLRRAKVEVTIASATGNRAITSSHKAHITADALAEEVDYSDVDLVVLPGGIPGVETRGELVYTFGVAKKKIGLGAMCRVLAENPAKLYGLFPRKGVLAPGSDADIVVYDPNADHVICLLYTSPSPRD